METDNADHEERDRGVRVEALVQAVDYAKHFGIADPEKIVSTALRFELYLRGSEEQG